MSDSDRSPEPDPEGTLTAGGEGSSPRPAGEAAVAPPSRIGPYRLLQKLGEGGMGEVWAAEQEEPIE